MARPLACPQMTRTPMQPGGSNWENQNYAPVKYYEARYNSTSQTPGPQEWIYGPGDSQPWAITIYFLAGAGSAFIEGTDEAPGDTQGLYPWSVPPTPPNPLVPGPNNIHTYALTDTVSDTTRVIVRSCTAVRVNVTGGTVDVTVCC